MLIDQIVIRSVIRIPRLAGSAFVRRVHQPHYFQLLSSYGELPDPHSLPRWTEKPGLLSTISFAIHYSMVRTRYAPSWAEVSRTRSRGSHFLPLPDKQISPPSLLVVNPLHCSSSLIWSNRLMTRLSTDDYSIVRRFLRRIKFYKLQVCLGHFLQF